MSCMTLDIVMKDPQVRFMIVTGKIVPYETVIAHSQGKRMSLQRGVCQIMTNAKNLGRKEVYRAKWALIRAEKE